MRPLLFTLCVCLLPLGAQNQAADPVVVTIDGKAFRRSEIETLVQTLSPTVAKNFESNRRGWLESYALMRRLAALAEKEGLDKRPEHALRIEYNRAQYLAPVMIQHADNATTVMPEEQRKYYDEHKRDYQSAQAKVIYVAFNNNPVPGGDPKAKKPLTEKEAQAKALNVVKQARAGVDFAKLVREASDDPETRAKNGDFPLLRSSDEQLPASLRSAIFNLQPGGITDPIRQPNGFYIFRVEALPLAPYDQVKDDIYVTLKKERLDKWIAELRQGASVVFNDPSYVTGAEKK